MCFIFENRLRRVSDPRVTLSTLQTSLRVTLLYESSDIWDHVKLDFTLEVPAFYFIVELLSQIRYGNLIL